MCTGTLGYLCYFLQSLKGRIYRSLERAGRRSSYKQPQSLPSLLSSPTNLCLASDQPWHRCPNTDRIDSTKCGNVLKHRLLPPLHPHALGCLLSPRKYLAGVAGGGQSLEEEWVEFCRAWPVLISDSRGQCREGTSGCQGESQLVSKSPPPNYSHSTSLPSALGAITEALSF